MFARQIGLLVPFQIFILVVASGICGAKVHATTPPSTAKIPEGPRAKPDSIREARARAQDSIRASRIHAHDSIRQAWVRDRDSIRASRIRAQDSIREARILAKSASDERIAKAKEDYRLIARQFNRDLAGRYPFGTTAQPDANPRFVCEFFRDHLGRWDSLQKVLDTVASFRETLPFLKNMAHLEYFLTGYLCSPLHNPVRITFEPMAQLSRDGYLIHSWSLSDGIGKALYPEGPKTLDWTFGSPIAFEIKWVDWSAWLPLQDTTPSLFVDGNTANFLEKGDWSLVRLIEKHRDTEHSGSATISGNTEILLKFIVPILHKHELSTKNSEKAALYIRLNFEGREPGSRVMASRFYHPMWWPGPFPKTAPEPYRRL